MATTNTTAHVQLHQETAASSTGIGQQIDHVLFLHLQALMREPVDIMCVI